MFLGHTVLISVLWYCGGYRDGSRNTKEDTSSVSHNKPRNAISKGDCLLCKYHPGDESWFFTCNSPKRCMQGEMWEPLETASVD
jgi:hypothetical protein